MAFFRLTLMQRCNIHDLEWHHGIHRAGEVGFAGIDANDNPVVWVAGGHGEKLIAWPAGGNGVPVRPPLRDFTDAELSVLPPEDGELLFGLRWMVHLFEGKLELDI